jgi:hypothetical protein
MRDAPDTRDLIETARETLKAKILPELSGDAKYVGAMISNALGIALRDLDATDRPAEELLALRDLMGASEGTLEDLNTDFARAIREGRFDPGRAAHGAARRILWAQTAERLERVNPNRLETERRAGTLPESYAPWRGKD